jgi:hypothetical protein
MWIVKREKNVMGVLRDSSRVTVRVSSVVEKEKHRDAGPTVSANVRVVMRLIGMETMGLPPRKEMEPLPREAGADGVVRGIIFSTLKRGFFPL